MFCPEARLEAMLALTSMTQTAAGLDLERSEEPIFSILMT
jgi:hypothetical protein